MRPVVEPADDTVQAETRRRDELLQADHVGALFPKQISHLTDRLADIGALLPERMHVVRSHLQIGRAGLVSAARPLVHGGKVTRIEQ